MSPPAMLGLKQFGYMPVGDGDDNSEDARSEHGHNDRRVGIPADSIFGLGFCSPLEPAFGCGRQAGIVVLVVAASIFQGLLIVSLMKVERVELETGEGCAVTHHLQWLCILVFVMIIWEEVSCSFELVELLAIAKTERRTSSRNSDSSEDLDGCGTRDNGVEDDEDSGPGAGQGVSSTRTITTVGSSDEARGCWSMILDGGVSSSDGGWQLCNCFGMSMLTNKEEIYARQFDGFDVTTISRPMKLLLFFYIVLPKLCLELALVMAGSIYIAVSRTDADAISSVVAVNFISTVDEIFLHCLFPVTTLRALDHTDDLVYTPQSPFAELWVWSRTGGRMWVDAILCSSITHILYMNARHVGCGE